MLLVGGEGPNCCQRIILQMGLKQSPFPGTLDSSKFCYVCIVVAGRYSVSTQTSEVEGLKEGRQAQVAEIMHMR